MERLSRRAFLALPLTTLRPHEHPPKTTLLTPEYLKTLIDEVRAEVVLAFFSHLKLLNKTRYELGKKPVNARGETEYQRTNKEIV